MKVATAPADPALAVIERFGITDRAAMRAIAEQVGNSTRYHWLCASGYAASEVPGALRLTNAGYERLVEVFGVERGTEIEDAIYEAAGQAVNWCLARAHAAEAAANDAGPVEVAA